MNVKLVKNEMINGDIVTPVMTYATFNEDLTESTKEKIVNSLNHGHKMLQIYEMYLGNNGHGLNIKMHNIVEMLTEMDEVFHDYDKESFYIKKKENVR